MTPRRMHSSWNKGPAIYLLPFGDVSDGSFLFGVRMHSSWTRGLLSINDWWRRTDGSFGSVWLLTHYNKLYRPQYWAIREAYTGEKPLNYIPEIRKFELPDSSFKSGSWVAPVWFLYNKAAIVAGTGTVNVLFIRVPRCFYVFLLLSLGAYRLFLLISLFNKFVPRVTGAPQERHRSSTGALQERHRSSAGALQELYRSSTGDLQEL